jgi:FkbM family methyltransferase
MFDVGANVGGYIALAAAVVGPAGHVYAFEPGPDNLAALHDRFAGFLNVTVIEAAVSDRRGMATLFTDRRDPRRHSLAPANVGKSGPAVTVPQVCLDDYRPPLKRLDVLKVDAQGAELLILRGAERLIRSFHPALILEIWPAGLKNLRASADEVLQHVRSLGYKLHRLSADGSLKEERHIAPILTTHERWENINVVGVAKT